MPNILQRARKHGMSRRRNSPTNRPNPTVPIGITSVVAAGSVLTVTFDQSVALKGVPQYTTDVGGADALSAVATATNVVAITFSASIAAATVVNIPYEEAAIRNSSGGFVSHSTFPV